MAGVPMNSPMDAMVAMRMNQPQPQGVNQQGPTGGPDSSQTVQNAPGAPQGAAPGSQPPNPLQGISEAALGHGNLQALLAYLPMLQKLYPQLRVADLLNGEAELAGPTQEQFLGAAHAKHHGAKVHHVRNRGKGQRLHVRF